MVVCRSCGLSPPLQPQPGAGPRHLGAPAGPCAGHLAPWPPPGVSLHPGPGGGPGPGAEAHRGQVQGGPPHTHRLRGRQPPGGHIDGVSSYYTSPSQILDSAYEAVNQELGHHCGEAEQPKLIVRETERMELVFRSADRQLQTLNSQMQIEMVN